MSINSTRNKNLNLTSTNIANRLLLARCCYADYAIDFLQKKNIGDNEQASCYLNKMKQLYYSVQALCQFVPSEELSPSAILTGLSGNIGDTVTIYVNGVNISGTVTQTSTGTQLGVSMQGAIALYTNDYHATFDGSTFTLFSNTSGTEQNGYLVTFITTGAINAPTQTLSGGVNQWCLDDTKAQKILDNIDQLCGCPCDCDDNILTDTIPRYIN